MMLSGNILLFSIRTLLFHMGEQSCLLLVLENSWFFSLTTKLKNQVEKRFYLDHTGMLFILLNQKKKVFHSAWNISCIPKWNVLFCALVKKKARKIKGEIHKHGICLVPKDYSPYWEWERSCSSFEMSYLPGAQSYYQNCTWNPIVIISQLCGAECKWWTLVYQENGPIPYWLLFLNVLRTSFHLW